MSKLNPCKGPKRHIVDVANDIALKLTGQCRFHYAKDRESRINEDLLRIAHCLKNTQIGDEHALRALDNVEKMRVVATYPCYDEQRNVESCYEKFKNETLHCSKLTHDFQHCINCTKSTIIKRHLYKELQT